MNNLLAICGLVLIGNVSTPNVAPAIAQKNFPTNEIKCPIRTMPIKLVSNKVLTPKCHIDLIKQEAFVGKNEATVAELDLNRIVFLEAEEQIDLGFDTADYLPENFDPNKVYLDLNKVTYMEWEEYSLSDLNTTAYLPKDFNPYANPEDFRAVSYIEEEPMLDLDTEAYLPEGFDPYEFYFDIHSVEYLEDDEVELDFNTQDYLPRGFDPYSR